MCTEGLRYGSRLDEGRGYSHSVRAIGRLNTTAVEEESDRVGRFALSLAEGVHQFLQSGCALDLEEHLVVVIGDFDVEMFGRSSAFRLSVGRAAILVGA